MVRLLDGAPPFPFREPDEREPYTIVIPPPNVTGMRHMGHMLNNTLQDVLVRRARMQGKNACWVRVPTMPRSLRRPRWWPSSRPKESRNRRFPARNSYAMPGTGRRNTAVLFCSNCAN